MRNKALAIYLRAGQVVLSLADWVSEESSSTEMKLELRKGKFLEEGIERARAQRCED